MRHGRSFPFKAHIGYQGRIGIYFNRVLMSGVVTLAGTPVSGAIVRLIRQSTDTEIDKTTTNASGSYTFTGYTKGIVMGENYHIAVEYTDGSSNKYNAASLWNINPIVTTT